MSNLLLYQSLSQLSQFCRSLCRNFRLTVSREVAESQLKSYKSRTCARENHTYIIFYNNCDFCDNCDLPTISTLFKVAIKKIIATNCDFPTHSTLSAHSFGVKN